MKRSPPAVVAKETLTILKKGSYQNNLDQSVHLVTDVTQEL